MSAKDTVTLIIAVIFFILTVPLFLKMVENKKGKILMAAVLVFLFLSVAAGYSFYKDKMALQASVGTDNLIKVRQTIALLDKDTVKEAAAADDMEAGRYMKELEQHRSFFMNTSNGARLGQMLHAIHREYKRLEEAEGAGEKRDRQEAALEQAAEARESLTRLEEELGEEKQQWYKAFYDPSSDASYLNE
ncbi:hypothetical protein [Salibacterium aidingense]|uniref:hypothetical protein n=1 Tax=Salibacterium aidingense TaxID=384933 RepID=UPI0004123656|nr:hypothetical protein [Salibacterium aidingense]